MNFNELLNIQNRDCPRLGPSFRNSWPNPLPHLPQDTWEIPNTVSLLSSAERRSSHHLPISQGLEPCREAVLKLTIPQNTSTLKIFGVQLGVVIHVFNPSTKAITPTFKASGRFFSGHLVTLSAWMVSVNAGHGDECAYFERLENNS